MKQMLSGFLHKLGELDKVEITHKLRCDTAVNDKRTDTTQCVGKNLSFHFSLLKGLIALGIGLTVGAGLILSSKKCVEKKLLRRIEEKYFLVPVDQYRKTKKEKEN